MLEVRAEFEKELTARGLTFEFDAETDRYRVQIEDFEMMVNLDNVARDVEANGDLKRVSRFVDAIVETAHHPDDALVAENLYWSLEPNDYDPPADIRVPLSGTTDRVLVHISPGGRTIRWVTPEMLAKIELSPDEAGAIAFANLDRALAAATFESQTVDEAKLGYFVTDFPCKAALLLAPTLRDIVEPTMGWPVLAVAPDRDFVYVWGAEFQALTGRVGPVVVREFSNASYPISTEVWSIDDDNMQAIGEFPTSS
ncbi:hypothetical protein AB1L30_02905 [Bremerella sp. JC817]|uniref:hypothetical protein n=1 Tax=Bremerella sp. JC817 TaxID=3231756 RepID=UPI0034593439